MNDVELIKQTEKEIARLQWYEDFIFSLLVLSKVMKVISKHIRNNQEQK